MTPKEEREKSEATTVTVAPPPIITPIEQVKREQAPPVIPTATPAVNPPLFRYQPPPPLSEQEKESRKMGVWIDRGLTISISICFLAIAFFFIKRKA